MIQILSSEKPCSAACLNDKSKGSLYFFSFSTSSSFEVWYLLVVGGQGHHSFILNFRQFYLAKLDISEITEDGFYPPPFEYEF